MEISQLLADYGLPGLGILAVGHAYLRERAERQETQKRLEAALTAQADSRAALLHEVITAMGTLEKAILTPPARGGHGNG